MKIAKKRDRLSERKENCHHYWWLQNTKWAILLIVVGAIFSDWLSTLKRPKKKQCTLNHDLWIRTATFSGNIEQRLLNYSKNIKLASRFDMRKIAFARARQLSWMMKKPAHIRMHWASNNNKKKLVPQFVECENCCDV